MRGKFFVLMNPIPRTIPTDRSLYYGQGGLFFGRMVLKALASHLDIVSVLQDSELTLQPKGAVLLACQAVSNLYFSSVRMLGV